MNRKAVFLATALFGSAVASATYFYGKRLQAADFEREQDYRIYKRRLARGLALLIAIGLLVKSAPDPDDDEP